MRKHLKKLLPLLGLALVLQACSAPPGEDVNEALTQAAATLYAELTANAPAGGDATATTTSAPSEPSDTPTPEETTVTVSVDTNCRNGTGNKYYYEGALLVGEIGIVVGKPDTSGQFLLIQNPDGPGTCWITLEYATVNGSLDGIPIVAVPPVPTDSSIAGIVWNDHCSQLDPGDPPPGCDPKPVPGPYPANGVLDPGETGFAGVRLELGAGACPSSGLATTHTNGSGNYVFANLEAGEYCISIDALHATNVPILIPGGWSYPIVGGAEAFTTVTVGPGEEKTGVNFGWDFQLD